MDSITEQLLLEGRGHHVHAVTCSFASLLALGSC
jgi:hypothetical protein